MQPTAEEAQQRGRGPLVGPPDERVPLEEEEGAARDAPRAALRPPDGVAQAVELQAPEVPDHAAVVVAVVRRGRRAERSPQVRVAGDGRERVDARAEAQLVAVDDAQERRDEAHGPRRAACVSYRVDGVGGDA